MKKILALCLASVLLSGCSVATITNQPPIFSGHSDKEPSKVARCLASKMSDLNPSTKSVETETGYRLVVSDSDFGALVVAVLTAANNGTDVKMHANIIGYGNPWGKAAIACL